MKTMNAIVLREIGNPDHLYMQETDVPVARPGEALIRLKAASLNHRDWWIVQGRYAKIKVPVILGSDGCGSVAAVGDENDSAWVGRTVIIDPSLAWGADPKAQGKEYRILGMPDNGTLAEYVVVPCTNLHDKPEHLSEAEAAALPLAGLTAYRALFTQGRLAKGETLLITGIGGGVASLILPLALAAGAKVFVTSGDPSKIERAVKSGAIGGANYHDADAYKQLAEWTKAAGGIDLVVDGAGGSGFGELLNVVKPGGRVVTYGATAGNPDSLDLRKIFWKQLTLQGSTMGTAEDFKAMTTFVGLHKIRPAVDKEFAMGDFRGAFERMAGGGQFGKIIIRLQP